MKNKEIAVRVGTTEQVVKNYLRKVYDKLGVADRLELALYCLNHRVAQKEPDQKKAAQDVPADAAMPAAASASPAAEATPAPTSAAAAAASGSRQ